MEERESLAGLSSSVKWLIYKSGGWGNVTGRVMVRNSLKDSFVSQVRHSFTSLNSLLYLLFLPIPVFFSVFLPSWTHVYLHTLQK